jgi:FHA domain-containing protein
MEPVPGLTPLPPLDGARRAIDRSPFWIGSDRSSPLPVFTPGVLQKHAAILLREDGYWISPNGGELRVNGSAISTSTRLNDGDTVELAVACAFRFDNGAPKAVEAPAAVAAAPPPPRRRRRSNLRVTRRQVAIGTTIAVIVALLGGGIGLAVYAYRHRPVDTTLSAADAAALDSLLVVAYDHIERGSTLLEIGVAPAALTEFASGINVLRTSRLRNHPGVVPRIEAMEASVAAIYRERRLEVPTAYRNLGRVAPDAGRSLKAALSVTDFAQRFEDVRRVFSARYAKTVVVTGSDHAEHLSLYGRGGAMDLRTKDLSVDEVRFLIGEFKTRGIRVKDFSADSVLQRQINSAIKAGLADRAGTGLHLHVDRFANRRDAFTI